MNTRLPDHRIPISKTKSALLLVGAVVFVIAGAYVGVSGALDPGLASDERLFAVGLGAVTVLFFGGCGIVALRKLAKRGPGLILRSDGFHDASSGTAVGWVPWSAVTGMDVQVVRRQPFLVVHVTDPDAFERRGTGWQRAFRRGTTRMTGSPVAIATVALKTDLRTLDALMRRYFEAARGEDRARS